MPALLVNHWLPSPGNAHFLLWSASVGMARSTEHPCVPADKTSLGTLKRELQQMSQLLL